MFQSFTHPKKRAFTLIELLIVVAIIAILAAIAVPNFLEAQTRSRVSRVQSDLRVIALAMESYYVDNSGYPAAMNSGAVLPVLNAVASDPRLLTTPIAYVTTVPKDTFRDAAGLPSRDYLLYGVGYAPNGAASYTIYPRISWMTWSYGPDRVTRAGGYRTLPAIERNEGNPVQWGGIRYDPTNGTVSDGDVYRFSAEAERRPN